MAPKKKQLWTSSIWRVLQWLSSKEKDDKHEQWMHPTVVCILVTVSVVGMTTLLSDWFMAQQHFFFQDDALFYASCPVNNKGHTAAAAAAFFLGTYAFILLLVRLLATGSMALYEFLWACNISMILATIGIGTCRPILVGAAAVSVSVDQVLWYVDLLGFVLTRGEKFVVGVAKYLTWEQTSWARRLTSTHHLWFIPYCIWTNAGPFPWSSYLLSIVYVSLLNVLCRCTTPFHIGGTAPSSPSPPPAAPLLHDDDSSPATRSRRRSSNGGKNNNSSNNNNNRHSSTTTITTRKEKEGEGKNYHKQQRHPPQQPEPEQQLIYLNVNLVYELWKDIKYTWLQLSHPHAPTHLLRLTLLWNLLNLPFTLLIIPLSHYFKA